MSKSKYVHELWMALFTLEDHFHRLGGSARFNGMSDSDIPLYVGCQLAKKMSSDFSQEEYVISKFMEAASRVLPEINSRIESIEAEETELLLLLEDFLHYVNPKLNKRERAESWSRFSQWVSEHTPNTSLQPTSPLSKSNRGQTTFNSSAFSIRLGN